MLLILVGVTLNIVTGNNGILGKASGAVDKTKEASAKEQVELKIAEFQQEFYEAVYVNTEGTADVNTKKGKWIAQNKTGNIETEDYTFEITGANAPYTVTIKQDNTLETDIVGSLTDDGILSWTSSGTGGTLFSQIDATNYGEYVDLGTSLIVNDNIKLEDGTKPTTDWRIFHKDTNGTWLILADYLPYSNESTLGTGLANEGSTYPYKWNSTTSRSDLLTRLEDSTAWNKLLASTYTSKGITVKGAIELETYKESWNAKGYTTMYLAGDDTNGYYVKGGSNDNITSSYNYDFSSDAKGYGNTLYYPHKNFTSRNNAYGYWLASPSAFNALIVMYVGCNGYVTYDYKDTFAVGVRPAVYLPSDILAEKNATTGVWEIK